MKVDKSLLPLKAHYFFFLGAMSPILPFAMVIVKQLGIPVITQGYLAFFALLVTVVAKPIIGAAADAFPKLRKIIFLLMLGIMYFGMSSICFLPSMHKQVIMEGQSLELHKHVLKKSEGTNKVNMLLGMPKIGECYVSEAWDCMVPCAFNGNQTVADIKHIVLDEKSLFQTPQNISASVLVYTLKGIEQTTCDPYQHLKFDCKGGIYSGSSCPSLFSVGAFWIYLLLFITSQVAFTTSNSITDAICMDCIGDNGKYGAQRAWGTVGWGVIAPISGLLIDLWSGDTYSKNYAPVIAIVMCLGLIDLTITSTKLKVPRLDSEANVWKTVGQVLKKPHVLLFLLFVVLNGAFDGIILLYIFVLQEEMATDTSYMQYIKFIQGILLAAQCCLEAPFMWIFYWFYKKLGAIGITKIIFFLYMIRLLLLALIGTYGPVWATLISELLNGPCYGLGYTAIVVQAGNITPPGTSATIQSVVNICYESIGYGISSVTGGIIYHKYGAKGIYYIFSAVSAFTFIFYLISAKFLQKLNYNVTNEYANGNINSATAETKLGSNDDELGDAETKAPMLINEGDEVD